jgi:hypothetical protein
MIQRDLDQQLFLPSKPHFVVRLLYTHPTQSVILSLVSKCLILATPTSPIGRRGVIGSIAVSSYPRRPLWTASLRLLPSSSRGPIPAYIRGASKDLRANTATLAYLSVPGTGTAFWLVLLLGNYAGSYNARNDADSNAGNAYGMVVWECQYGNYAGNKNVSSNNAAGNPVSK